MVAVRGGIIASVPAIAVLVLIAAALVALGVAASRRGERALAATSWVTAVGVLGAPLCLSLVTVGLFFAQHHVRWMWAFGAFVDVVLVWGVVDTVAARWPGALAARVRVAVPVALTVVLAVITVPYFAQQQGPVADYAAMPAMRRVFRQLDSLRSSAPVVYDTSNIRVFEPYSSAVMMALQDRGIEFRSTDEGMVRQLGDGRRADGTETTTVFQLEREFALGYDGPACRIAIASALDPDAEAAADATADELAAGIVDGSLTIDVDALGDLDAAAQDLARAAAAGDPAAAWWVVRNGSLNAATLTGRDDIGAALDQIGARVTSTFGLFALDPQECPTQP
jgi:hypothetical protein